LFNYEKALFMNSGAEANETAIKLARKWGYTHKGIAADEAIVVCASRNFHGRTTTIISASTDPVARSGFGPFTPGFEIVPYDDVSALSVALANPRVCALLIEPIQGEAGVYVPQPGYLKSAADLCRINNVLLLMDEIQTGIARTGKMLACDHEGVHPDVLILGKALSGGVLPVSVVLSSSKIMLVIKPGEHGSTFGGNPLSAAVCMEALQVVVDEGLADNAERLGIAFRGRMDALAKRSSLVEAVRGKGLLNAIVINDSPDSTTAWDLCMALMKAGLLAKPTHGNVVRLAPPLIITGEQLDECCEIIEETVLAFRG
jgi:ornithine--oxo-acid transaminase